MLKPLKVGQIRRRNLFEENVSTVTQTDFTDIIVAPKSEFNELKAGLRI
jgi:hypothetical protein